MMDLTELKGIGEKTKEYYGHLGVHTVEELLEFFPRDYELFFAPITVGEIGYQTFVTVRGAFRGSLFSRKTGRGSITTGTFTDEAGGTIRVTWFNAPYLKNQIRTGQIYILRGRVSRKYGVMELDQPKIYSPDAYEKLMGSLQPVYALTKGLSNAAVIKAVKEAMDSPAFQKISSEVLPAAIRDRYGLEDRGEAVRNMHFPRSDRDFSEAVKRMSFEEIFLFVLAMKQSQAGRARESRIRIEKAPETDAFLEALPFSLTGAQQRVIGEIRQDLSSGTVMNRLLQGDVGSGKTLVALAALMDAGFAGYQGALMAPTEVLARQHYETVSRFFKEYGIDLHAALLTGSMSALEKKVVYDAVEDGRIHILVGTHALIQDKVRFSRLGLVITDEQHRFGIRQREALAEKCRDGEPHMLVMSATPIPRTLALIIYGNMAVSRIDELPASRKPIKNAVISGKLRENAYKFIARETAAGHQAYVICPLIEYSEGLDAVNATDYAQMLKEIWGTGISVGLLHGQMPSSDKQEIMEKFSDGRIRVLVSTTVVEVGVDVPNATVMMIEDADRFGLAQLHQLRGRVGRGDAQSYCILVSNKDTPEAKERLEVLSRSDNGFEIAAKDLEMRGPGEFMGIRQSGAMNFKNFDLYRDGKIAGWALEAAEGLLGGTVPISKAEQEILDEKTAGMRGQILL